MMAEQSRNNWIKSSYVEQKRILALPFLMGKVARFGAFGQTSLT